MGFIPLYCFCCLWMLSSSLESDEFLFGTSGSNLVWLQNGTKEWIDSKQKPSTTIINYQQQFLGVHGASYFFRRNLMVFSDKGAKSIFITDVSTTNKLSSFVYVGTSSSVGHLAVDWLSGNVYWCDGTFGWIGMIALPQSVNSAGVKEDFKVVADTFIDIPSGIAVQPDYQWIFWTDIGRQPKIERSGLDGINRHVTVLHGLIKPVSIATDPKLGNIVWTDPARGTIELCDYYGNNRKVIHTDVGAKYYGIEAVGNFVIVSEQNRNEIRVLSVTDGSEVTSPYTPGIQKVSAIALYTADNQFGDSDLCQTKGCSQICLVKSSTQAECRCEDGFTLDSDGVSCSVQNKILVRSIVYVNNSKICSLPITHINIHQLLNVKPDCTLGGVPTGSITHLAIDIESEELFFSIGASIYKQAFYQSYTVLHNEDSDITGLTFDWITNRLYWTSARKIMYLDKTVSPPNVSRLNVNTNNPTYITASPIDDLLFVISGGQNGKQIESVHLQNMTAVVLESTRLSDPKWLTYDRHTDRLYWIDGVTIGSMSSSGKGINIKNIGGSDTLSGIGVYKDYVMWQQSSSGSVGMHVDNINSEQETFSFAIPDMALNPSTFVFFDRNNQPTKNVPCIKDNGGCQQICVVHGVDPKCDCYLGYTLQSDQKTCAAEQLQKDFFLTIDSINSKLFKLKNTSSVVAVDTGTVSPTSVAVDYQSVGVVWIDGGNSIKSAGFDGSNEITVTAESVNSITSVDVDSSTGNIYYTTKDSIKVYSVRYSTKKTLITGLSNADNLKLYLNNGKMYWTEKNVNAIKQAFMDGSDVTNMRTESIVSPSDLSIDISGGRLIWSDVDGDMIESISLTNINDRRILLSNTGERPVAIDADDQYVYYVGLGQREIRRIGKLDGTGAASVFENVLLGRLKHLLIVSEDQRSEHALCKSDNGQCSRLCLPRGLDQRTCQCADGVSLATDGRKCVGDVQCPAQYDSVIVSQSCSRYVGTSCSFSCKPGTEQNGNFTSITCLHNEQWDVTSSILCKDILCEEHILNGALSSACDRKAGNTCSFTCNEGYQKKFPTLFCQSNGEWGEDTDTICAVVQEKSSDSLGIGGIVGLVGGGVVVMVIFVTAIVVFQLKKMRKETKETRDEMRVVYTVNSTNGHLRDLGASGYSDTLTTCDVEEVYDVIIDDDKLYREKTHASESLGASNSSHRYSKWPLDIDPPPDYLEVIAGGNSPCLNQKFLKPNDDGYVTLGGASPYLTPKSISNSVNNTRYERPLPDYGHERPLLESSHGRPVHHVTQQDNKGFLGADDTDPYLIPK